MKSIGWSALILATAIGQSAQAQSTSSPAQPSSSESQVVGSLEEVVVTAEKKAERLQDVPLSVTVLSPQNLEQNGLTRLADYFATVPGFSLNGNTFGGGTQFLVIRGLSTGAYQNPSVATVIDDVPTGASTELAFGEISPTDIDPADLERIEVLKGPQGTLYGADSLGGIVKYVTKDPSTDAFSGHAEAEGVDVPEGGLGYAIHAGVNVPLTSTLAIRASGFFRQDPGWIKNVTTGESNANSADVSGGHLAALWTPSENLSLKISALLENANADSSSWIDSNAQGQPTLGARDVTSWPGSGGYKSQSQLFWADLKAKLGSLDFVSLTAYGGSDFHNSSDQYLNYGGGSSLPNSQSEYGVPGAVFVNSYNTKKFSQEFRLSSTIGPLEWLAGAFYTNETSPNSAQSVYAANTSGQDVGNIAVYGNPELTFSEAAIFGTVTFHFTNRFDIEAGAREGTNRTAYVFAGYGPTIVAEYGSSPYNQPAQHSKANAFTYLVSPSFKISQDLMVYARVATGYRVGGPNLTDIQGIPSSYAPDKTTNYEVGAKGDVPAARISFDAAAYYISWKNFQIGEENADYFYYEGNAGDAKSEGVEASFQLHPLTGLTLSAQGSYNNAVLTQNLPPSVINGGAYAVAGDRLPYSVPWSGGITAEQNFPLESGWTGLVGATITYLGARDAEFAYTPTSIRLEYPGYTSANVHVGALYDLWTVNLYVNNVTNERGITGIRQGTYYPTGGYYTTYIQPLTVGIVLSRTF